MKQKEHKKRELIIVKDRYGIELHIGDKVKHFDRKDINCKDMLDYIGVVVSIETNQLPLIGVDCGVEFIRLIPYMDLVHIEANEQEDS
jgi:hypothetical protein